MAQACNPSTLGGQGGWITRSRDRDPPGQIGETPSLLKIQKITQAWGNAPVIPDMWKAERELLEPSRQAAVSQYQATALQPSRQTKIPSQKKKKKKERKTKCLGVAGCSGSHL